MRLLEFPLIGDNGDSSAKVAELIGQALGKALALGSVDSEQVFLGLAGELNDVTNDPNDRVEIKRRLAEARVSLYYDRRDSEEFAEQAWQDLESLGYRTAEREATVLWYRAKYLLLQGRLAEFETVVCRLECVVDKSIAPENESMAAHFQQSVANLRSA